MKKYDKFFAGIEANAYNLFGAHKLNDGVEFCVFAPNARQAEVYMSNNWGNSYKMNKIDSRGICHILLRHRQFFPQRYQLINQLAIQFS